MRRIDCRSKKLHHLIPQSLNHMISFLVNWCLKNRFLVIAAYLGVTLWGIYSMFHTPVDAIPDLSENQVIVFTEWMGRSAQELEDQVTYPLSTSLQGLAGVKTVRASSAFGFSMLTVILKIRPMFILPEPACWSDSTPCLSNCRKASLRP